MKKKKFYKNILVGGSGFIGSKLAMKLTGRGESVLSMARGEQRQSIGGVDVLTIDVTSRKVLEELFPFGERIYILIGQNHADFNIEGELSLLNNLIYVINDRRPQEVIYLSSVLVYGESKQPADESSALRPIDPYSRFKCEAERLLQEKLHPSIHIGILRLANVYGSKKNRGFIGLTMDRLAQANQNPLVINGDGLQERDYIFIDDVIEAILAVADNLKGTDVVNIATGKSSTLLDVIKEVSCITGEPLLYEKNNKVLVEVIKSRVSSQKLWSAYGFGARTSLRDGIRKTFRRSMNSDGVVTGKRILLLGGEGFIGRNLADYFGEQNLCFSVGRNPTLFLDRQDTFIQTDPYVTRIEGEYDVVIHLIDNKVPLEVFMEQEEQLVNNIGFNGRHHLILFSSAVVYANPDSDYGQRKKALENFYQNFCKEKQIRLTILRPFNLYGPYQIPFRPGSLVANLLLNHLDSKSTDINDLDATRDFLFIGDLVRLVERVIEGEIVGVHDLGSGRRAAIRELIMQLETVLQKKIQIVDKVGQDMSRDCQAKGDLLNDIVMVNLNEGLRRTLDFYKENFSFIKNVLKGRVR